MNNTEYDVESDSLSNTSDDTKLTILYYSIDDDGQIRSKLRRMFDNEGNVLRSTEYDLSYDALGRIKAETYDGGGQYAKARWYEYDHAGNRTRMLENGDEYVYTYNSQHQLTAVNIGSTTRCFQYDTLGNLIQDWIDVDDDNEMDVGSEEGKILSWTPHGKIHSATAYQYVGGFIETSTVEYTYDYTQQSLLLDRSTSEKKTRFHWSGYNLYLEEDNSDSKYAYFNQPFALDGFIARFDLDTDHQLEASDTASYYLYDEAGNVILITDATGEIVTRFEQDSWGNDLNDTFGHALNITHHKTARYYDGITGLYYVGTRWYDPELGRFVSQSTYAPLWEEEYAYCANDPVNLTDVNGWVARARPLAVSPCGQWYPVPFKSKTVSPCLWPPAQ